MENTAIKTLKELRQGAALDELADAIGEVVAHVRHTGRAGKVTLTLSVKPLSKGKTDVIAFDDVVTMKLPRLERETTMLYVDDDGVLSRNDPRQPKLPELREVTQFPRPSAAESIPVTQANER